MSKSHNTVIPILTRVIAGFDHWLCPMYNDGTWLDFDPDCINALTEKRQAQWSKLQHADFLTRNEKRQAAGYDPVAGGDEDDSTDTDPSPAAKFNPNHDPHIWRIACCTERFRTTYSRRYNYGQT